MEIKQGMYVRTKDGELFQCLMINIDESNPSLNRFMNEWGNMIMFDEIEGEPSYDIFDLIKPGDYVNGRLVYQVGYNFMDDLVLKMSDSNYNDFIYPKDVKTIVTKEQFEHAVYEVKHESTN